MATAPCVFVYSSVSLARSAGRSLTCFATEWPKVKLGGMAKARHTTWLAVVHPRFVNPQHTLYPPSPDQCGASLCMCKPEPPPHKPGYWPWGGRFQPPKDASLRLHQPDTLLSCVLRRCGTIVPGTVGAAGNGSSRPFAVWTPRILI